MKRQLCAAWAQIGNIVVTNAASFRIGIPARACWIVRRPEFRRLSGHQNILF